MKFLFIDWSLNSKGLSTCSVSLTLRWFHVFAALILSYVQLSEDRSWRRLTCLCPATLVLVCFILVFSSQDTNLEIKLIRCVLEPWVAIRLN